MGGSVECQVQVRANLLPLFKLFWVMNTGSFMAVLTQRLESEVGIVPRHSSRHVVQVMHMQDLLGAGAASAGATVPLQDLLPSCFPSVVLQEFRVGLSFGSHTGKTKPSRGGSEVQPLQPRGERTQVRQRSAPLRALISVLCISLTRRVETALSPSLPENGVRLYQPEDEHKGKVIACSLPSIFLMPV